MRKPNIERWNEYWNAIGNSKGYFTRKKIFFVLTIVSIPFIGLIALLMNYVIIFFRIFILNTIPKVSKKYRLPR